MLRCTLFLLLLLNSKVVISQTVPVWEIYNMYNSGLPDNTIRCLQLDNNGALWVGTDNGLAKFEDNVWEVFNETNSGLADNYVRALAVDEFNNIWIGSTLGGVQMFDGFSWTNYNTATSDIPDNFIRTISIDQLGNKWIGTVEGLSYFNGTNWRTWKMSNSPLLTNNIASIGIGQNNEKYIGTINGGAVYMDIDTNFLGVHTILNSGIPDNSQLKVEIDPLGKPWFAGSAGGFFTDQGNQTWMAFNHNNCGLPTNSMTTMELDDQFNFYLGTQQCGLIVKRVDQTWEYYTEENSPLPENYLISLAKQTISNDLWIGTFSQGLIRMHESQLGEQEMDGSTDLTAFPNPTSGSNTIWFNTLLVHPTFSLFTADGKLISTTSVNGETITFQLPELSSGTYVLNVQEAQTIKTLKILITGN